MLNNRETGAATKSTATNRVIVRVVNTAATATRLLLLSLLIDVKEHALITIVANIVRTRSFASSFLAERRMNEPALTRRLVAVRIIHADDVLEMLGLVKRLRRSITAATTATTARKG